MVSMAISSISQHNMTVDVLMDVFVYYYVEVVHVLQLYVFMAITSTSCCKCTPSRYMRRYVRGPYSSIHKCTVVTAVAGVDLGKVCMPVYTVEYSQYS